ncbi:hypothetical protein J6590_067663 [Homalodisca vitripennis]|nr:hypothetical protein J6590_067663 [Homalodisca vitripennis]
MNPILAALGCSQNRAEPVNEHQMSRQSLTKYKLCNSLDIQYLVINLAVYKQGPVCRVVTVAANDTRALTLTPGLTREETERENRGPAVLERIHR